MINNHVIRYLMILPIESLIM